MKTNSYLQGFLANGLEYFILERKPQDTCSVTVLYRVGSAHETAGDTGIAHLLEHMMFKGTAAFPAGVLDNMSLRLGGETNAMTARDYTAYFHILPTGNWHQVLELEKDRMTALQFDEQAFHTEKSVVIEERSMYRDDPNELLYDLHYRLAFAPHHPYHHPIIGHYPDLSRLPIDKMQSFYKKHYQLKNACVMVVGNIDKIAAKDYICQYFGTEANTTKRQSKIPEPTYPQKKIRRPLFKVITKDIQYIRLKASYPAPPLRIETEAAGRVLEELLADARSSILTRLMVEELNLSDEIYASLNTQKLGGRFFIDCELQNAADYPLARQAIEQTLQQLCLANISDSELEAARIRALANLMFDSERLDELTFELMPWLESGQVRQYFSLPQKIKKITKTELQLFCQKIFQPSQLIVTCASPPEQALELEKYAH